MFFDMDDFCRSILATTPSFALVTWENDRALMSFLQRLEPALQSQASGVTVSPIDCTGLDSGSFAKQFLSALADSTCLAIYHIEPLVMAVGKILNGFRERLGGARAVVVAIRMDRKRDLIIQCPDLFDWSGLSIVRAEDLARPFTIHEVRESIHSLEQHYGISTAAFLRKWQSGTAEDVDDGWLWKELITLSDELGGDV